MVKAGPNVLTALQEVHEKTAADCSSHVILQMGKLRPGKGERLSGVFALGLASPCLPCQPCLGHLQGQQVGGGGSGSRQK